MFLISWRGYWQELIDIILYMHLKTRILYNLFNVNTITPVALSIVRASYHLRAKQQQSQNTPCTKNMGHQWRISIKL
jgi:hypothetical protein